MNKISIKEKKAIPTKHFPVRSEVTKITEAEVEDRGIHIHVEWGGFFIPNRRFEDTGLRPKTGDDITIYQYGGSSIRGVDINGVPLFYLTDQEIEDEHEEWKRQYALEKEEQFEREKAKYDEQYESLPPEFKQRIDKFRKDNPKFRVDYESYELFCCTEAVKIANTLKTAEAVKKWSENGKSFGEVPTIDDGHSGNTIGAATQMAYWYLQQPDVITRIAGALSPLVGSREYEEKNKRAKLKK